MTVEARAEFLEDFAEILAFNMEATYNAKEAQGDLTSEHAVAGALAMFHFGLVMASKYPVEAAVLMIAADEKDAQSGFPISTDEAVDSIVRTFQRLRAAKS